MSVIVGAAVRDRSSAACLSTYLSPIAFINLIITVVVDSVWRKMTSTFSCFTSFITPLSPWYPMDIGDYDPDYRINRVFDDIARIWRPLICFTSASHNLRAYDVFLLIITHNYELVLSTQCHIATVILTTNTFVYVHSLESTMCSL